MASSILCTWPGVVPPLTPTYPGANLDPGFKSVLHHPWFLGRWPSFQVLQALLSQEPSSLYGLAPPSLHQGPLTLPPLLSLWPGAEAAQTGKARE